MPTYEVEVTGPIDADLSRALVSSGWTVHPQSDDRTLLCGASGATGTSIFRVLDLLNRASIDLVGVRQLEG